MDIVNKINNRHVNINISYSIKRENEIMKFLFSNIPFHGGFNIYNHLLFSFCFHKILHTFLIHYFISTTFFILNEVIKLIKLVISLHGRYKVTFYARSINFRIRQFYSSLMSSNIINSLKILKFPLFFINSI